MRWCRSRVITSGERPKATRHATHTFVTVYGMRLDLDGSDRLDPLESRLQVSHVSAFVMPRGIVTVRSDPDFDMEPVVERWEDDPELLKAIARDAYDAMSYDHDVTLGR